MTPNNRFPLGLLLITPAARDLITENNTTPSQLLRRHGQGDWGDISNHDKQANDESLLNDDRIISAYPLASGGKVWVITEADRSATTILLPDDY